MKELILFFLLSVSLSFDLTWVLKEYEYTLVYIPHLNTKNGHGQSIFNRYGNTYVFGGKNGEVVSKFEYFNGTSWNNVSVGSSLTNRPIYRYNANYWTDKTQRFWLYGGIDNKNNILYDMWKFGLDNKWVKMGYENKAILNCNNTFCSCNSPGSRHSSLTWTRESLLFQCGGMNDNDAIGLSDCWALHSNTGTWLQFPNSLVNPGKIKRSNTWLDGNSNLLFDSGKFFLNSTSYMWSASVNLTGISFC